MDTETTMPDRASQMCSCCGKPLPPGHLAWDYAEPDPVVLLSEAERAEWIAVKTAQIMQVRRLGNFIRVILPVPIEHDREATFGVWLDIPERDEWQRVIAAASQGGQAWAGVRFAGRLVTAVPPWPSIFGVWTQALAPAPNKVPRLVHSVDPVLNAVLTRQWPEDAIRSARHTYVPHEMTGGPTPNPYAGT
jgi:hypothetical protein